MSERKYKHAANDRDFELQRTIRQQACMIKMLVFALGEQANGGAARRVRVARESMQSVDIFAPLAVYVDPLSRDTMLCLGTCDVPAQWVRAAESDEPTGGLGTLQKLLFKSRPHLENGANGHPTDRHDARLILKEMDQLGLE